MKRPKVSVLNVLALLGVLVLVSSWTPWTFRTRGQSRVTHCKSGLKAVGTALEAYATDYSGRYPASLEQLEPKYLKEPPICPVVRKPYRYFYGLDAPGNDRGYEEYFYVECYGENHRDMGVEGNYPAYNAVVGLISRADPPGAPGSR